MTTIHRTPPPDDAPERVLAWNSDMPDRWLDRPSSYVRRFWGDPYTAWCEQPPP